MARSANCYEARSSGGRAVNWRSVCVGYTAHMRDFPLRVPVEFLSKILRLYRRGAWNCTGYPLHLDYGNATLLVAQYFGRLFALTSLNLHCPDYYVYCIGFIVGPDGIWIGTALGQEETAQTVAQIFCPDIVPPAKRSLATRIARKCHPPAPNSITPGPGSSCRLSPRIHCMGPRCEAWIWKSE